MITISRLWILVVCDRDPDVSPAHSNREHRPGSGVGVSSRVPRTTTRMHTHARVMESERWQPVIRQCGHKDTISLVYMSAKEPPRARVAGGSCCQPLLEGCELLGMRTGGLLSCLPYEPEGSWAARHKYHRGFELLSCAPEGSWVHLLTYHRYFECTSMRTGGLLSAPA